VVGATLHARDTESVANQHASVLDLLFTFPASPKSHFSTRDLAEDRNVNHANTPEEAGTFSLAGAPAYSNNLTIDGLDNNDDRRRATFSTIARSRCRSAGDYESVLGGVRASLRRRVNCAHAVVRKSFIGECSTSFVTKRSTQTLSETTRSAFHDCRCRSTSRDSLSVVH
jgi:hypothetical protein